MTLSCHATANANPQFLIANPHMTLSRHAALTPIPTYNKAPPQLEPLPAVQP